MVRRVRVRPVNVLIWAGVVLIGGAGSVVRFLVDGVVAGCRRP